MGSGLSADRNSTSNNPGDWTNETADSGSSAGSGAARSKFVTQTAMIAGTELLEALPVAIYTTDADGRLLVTSQRTRDQHLNLEDAREKVRALVHRALERPRPRRRTRPTRGSVERRLEDKRRRSETKSSRRDDR